MVMWDLSEAMISQMHITLIVAIDCPEITIILPITLITSNGSQII